MVLTTLLVGFVIQSFSECHSRSEEEEHEREKTRTFLRNARKSIEVEIDGKVTSLAWMVTPDRLNLMQVTCRVSGPRLVAKWSRRRGATPAWLYPRKNLG